MPFQLESAVRYLQTLISLTAMYEAALLKGRPAPNAAEFNTYAFIMLLVGTRQKDAATHFFQVCSHNSLCVPFWCILLDTLSSAYAAAQLQPITSAMECEQPVAHAFSSPPRCAFRRSLTLQPCNQHLFHG